MSIVNDKKWNYFRDHQKKAGIRLETLINQQNSPSVLAICGGRGSGKSTILNMLHFDLLKNNHIAINMDAATITEGQGIMASAIEALRVCTKDKFSKTSSKEEIGDIERKYTRCIDCARTSESSVHKLAREMAMTPEQYRSFLSSWDRNKNDFSKEFIKLQENILQNWKKSLNNNDTTKHSPKIFIILDDLDLCEAKLIRSWAVTFMKSHTANTPHLCWLLSFDRSRLVSILSGKKPNNSIKDFETGESTLAKIIAFQHQVELQNWSDQDKYHFTPFEITYEHKNLIERLKGLNREEFTSLLPDNPRGLESIYHWLHDEASCHDPKSQARPLSPTLLLRKFSEVNGSHALANYLKNVVAEQIALQFSWDNETEINDHLWFTIARSANKNSRLSGMPLPKILTELVKTKRPNGTFETLCNIALKENALTSFQMVRKIPFLWQRLQSCKTSFKFTESDIIAQFQENGEPTAWALVWGSWRGPEEARIWIFEMGPIPLLEALADMRSIEPTVMIHKVILTDSAWSKLQLKVENSIPKTLGRALERDPLLPKNFRALILLIDSWKDAPWSELEQVANFWMPITVAQISAGFLLIGYAYTIWSNQTILETMVGELAVPADHTDSQNKNLEKLGEGHLFYHLEPFSALKDKSAEHIDAAYGRILCALDKLLEIEPEHFDKFYEIQNTGDRAFTVLELTARQAIKEQLTKLLKLDAVRKLRLSGASS